ncbi:MAG: mannosyltransferase family protein [Patescibacteria group bacterium]
MTTKILTLFLFWRIALFLVAFFATILIPVFGGNFPYTDQVLKVTNLPSWIWGFGNFDGVHYLRIAQNGYTSEYSQAFFPLYPLFVSFATNLQLFLPKDLSLDTRVYVDPAYFITAFILSNLFFIFAVYLLYKLLIIDFSRKKTIATLALLVAFPTSFYFGSVYTESLFLLLTISAFYFIRKGNFLFSGIFILLATATRLFGLLLIPVFLVELYLKLKNNQINFKSSEFSKAIVGLFLAPMGILLYMLYLRLNFDNPLYFLTAQPFFGAGREAEQIILLPQVIFRYLKIFTTVPVNSPSFFNATIEFIFTVVPLIVLIVLFKRIRLSYLIFSLGCLILPTLTGTLSSMPRYALMGFLLLPYISKRYLKILVIIFLILQTILVSRFIRGYWVA